MPYQFLDSNSQFSKSFKAISESGFYKGLTPELGYQHKLGHIQKVMLFSQIIGLNENEDLEKIKQISAIIKDADALDRSRFSLKQSSRNSLNPQLLRTKTAKKNSIMEFAVKINQVYAGYILKENYPNEPIEHGDYVKTLQSVRHDYKLKNDGVRKEEKDIPIRLVTFLFSEVLKSMKIKDRIDDDELEL